MFTEISMTNFKSWRETGPVRMAPLTAFFGANSSGKSSLLQMLLLLKQTAESNDRNLVLKSGSDQDGYLNLGTPHEITYRDSAEMILNVVWDIPSSRKFYVRIPGEYRKKSISDLSFETVICTSQQRPFVNRLRYSNSDSNFSVDLSRLPNKSL